MTKVGAACAVLTAMQVGWVERGNSEHGYKAHEVNPIPNGGIRIPKQVGL